MALMTLFADAARELSEYYAGGSGRIVCEIGAAFAAVENCMDLVDKPVNKKACGHAIMLYNQWCDRARRAVLCWLWLSRILRATKDIRVLIADAVWDGGRLRASAKSRRGATIQMMTRITVSDPHLVTVGHVAD